MKYPEIPMVGSNPMLKPYKKPPFQPGKKTCKIFHSHDSPDCSLGCLKSPFFHRFTGLGTPPGGAATPEKAARNAARAASACPAGGVHRGVARDVSIARKSPETFEIILGFHLI